MFKNVKQLLNSNPETLRMKETLAEEIAACSQQIIQGTPKDQSWEWDDRFDVPMLVFPRDAEAEVLNLLSQHFLHQWTCQEIKSASPAVRRVLDNIFGLQEDQKIYATDASKEIFLVGLWWPWKNGLTFSLRISLAGKGVMGFDQEKIGQFLRHRFQL